jgi:hypothetical protein
MFASLAPARALRLAHTQLLGTCHVTAGTSCNAQVAQLLEAEYSPEEAAAVPLLQPDQLKLALDELS